MNINFSIIIPVYNAEHRIRKLLVKVDEFSKNYTNELIIIDSSSVDSTVKIIKNYIPKNIRVQLITIPKSKFNHGLTRNIGTSKSKGKYILFLSDDVELFTSSLFRRLNNDFRVNNRTLAVFGRQIPLNNATPLERMEISRDFTLLENFIDKNGLVIQDLKKPFIKYASENYFIWNFISNAFACYKRSFLIKRPFSKVYYGEDYIKGKEIIKLGFVKIYDSNLIVKHSHHYGLKDYYKREVADLNFYKFVVKNNKKINLHSKFDLLFDPKFDLLEKSRFLVDLFVHYIIKFAALISVVLGFNIKDE